jgi:hypothetical protein
MSRTAKKREEKRLLQDAETADVLGMDRDDEYVIGKQISEPHSNFASEGMVDETSTFPTPATDYAMKYMNENPNASLVDFEASVKKRRSTHNIGNA